jgi:branched-chain amino acid transport system permease protein
VLNLLVGGLVVAALYALVGFAWVLLMRTTGILNLASGPQLALCAFIFSELATTLHLPWAVVIPGMLLSLLVLAVLTHGLVFRQLTGRSEFALVVATLGLASILQGVQDLIWGSEARIVRAPSSDFVVSWPGGVTSTIDRLAGIAVAALVLAGAVAFFRYARTGIQMRAATEDPVLASQGAIHVDAVYIWGWFLALVAATLAGILFSYQNALTFEGLNSLGLVGMAPALVGGLTSIKGVIPGALIVGLSETFAVHWFGGSIQDVAPWLVILVVLMLRPQGLFGERRVERV